MGRGFHGKDAKAANAGAIRDAASKEKWRIHAGMEAKIMGAQITGPKSNATGGS
jgi:hypothetical protein